MGRDTVPYKDTIVSETPVFWFILNADKAEFSHMSVPVHQTQENAVFKPRMEVHRKGENNG
jgi:hypothetical protein